MTTLAPLTTSPPGEIGHLFQAMRDGDLRVGRAAGARGRKGVRVWLGPRLRREESA